MPLDDYTEILQTFAGSAQEVTTPTAVIQGGKDGTPWIAEGGWHTQSANGEVAPAQPKWFRVIRLQWAYSYRTPSRSGRFTAETGQSAENKTDNYTYFIGFDPNKAYFEASESPYQKFLAAPGEILLPIYAQGGNDQTSPRSLIEAGTTVMAVGRLLQAWGHTFKQWADAIDVPDSNWSGSAAGVFRRTLSTFSGRMQMINQQIESSKSSMALQTAGFQLMSTAGRLFETFADWAVQYQNSPQAALAAVWQDDIEKVILGENGWTAPTKDESEDGQVPKIDVPGYGDPTQQAFWDKLMATAHERWKTYIEVLNEDLTRLLPALDTAYQEAYEDFPTFFPSVPGAPRSGAGAGAGGGSGGGETNWDENGNNVPDYLEHIDTDGDGTPDHEDKTPQGSPADFDKNDNDVPDYQEHIDTDGDGTPDYKDKTPQGSPPDFDKNNNDVDDRQEHIDTDGDGTPDYKDKTPQGEPPDYDKLFEGRSGPGEGNAEDSNNNTIPDRLEKKDTDGDGFPDLWDSTPKGEPDVKTTAGGANGPGGSSPDLYQAGILQPGPVLGGGGGGLQVVPKGAKISSDGTVVGPDGQPVRDALGEKITVPPAPG